MDAKKTKSKDSKDHLNIFMKQSESESESDINEEIS